MEVFISENAFLAIAIGAVEVFQRETLGILLGYKTENCFVVQNAITYQSSERYPSEVQRDDYAYKRIKSFLENVKSPAKIIGDFHSHTQFGENKGGFKPSKEDIDEMKNGWIYLIVEINKKNKARTWDYNLNGTMSGTVGDYFLKLAAWYRNDKNGNPKLAKIKCPFGLGFIWSYD